MKKSLLVFLGCLSMALGIAGIFIPLLPTTPFLLVAAACFSRSSERLYHWLTHHRFFGVYIRSYLQFHAVSLKSKIAALTFLWTTIGTSAIFFVTALWLRIVLGVIATGVTVHILRLRTLTKDMEELVRMDEARVSHVR